MVWLPPGYDGSCSTNSSNHTIPLTLMCFLIKYFGGSNDDMLKDIYPAQDPNVTDFDFIIVGAGTAGCVVVNRLSEQSNWKILLLEAGDEEALAASVPRLFRNLDSSSIDYNYHVHNTRSTQYNQGKVMGGTSTINSMTYSRGSKADYDDWARMGNEGWSWNDMLPYFKKSENLRTSEILAKYPQYHNTSGNLIVERFPREDKRVPLFIKAFQQAGLRSEIDYNKGELTGVSRIQSTSVHGTRLSTNGAFIRPIRGKRSNLFVRLNARVTKIIIDVKTKRATGVEYELTSEDGTIIRKTANAAKEVIVSAGFINSPKLLMLSGVGPKDHLEQLNIGVIANLAVGRNLRDHCLIRVTLRLSSNLTTTSNTTRAGDTYEWTNTHEGIMSSRSDISIIAFYHTKFVSQPRAADVTYEVWGEATQEDGSFGRATLIVNLVRSNSVGYIKLNSVDPLNRQPDIKYESLVDPRDVGRMIEGLRFAGKVPETPALRREGIVIVPEVACTSHAFKGDDYLRCLIKNNVTQDSHGTGTCKMGPASDRGAVVNPQLKVYGVRGLRVTDSSIVPLIPRSGTMAPTIMVAERGSDMIKKDWL